MILAVDFYKIMLSLHIPSLLRVFTMSVELLFLHLLR